MARFPQVLALTCLVGMPACTAKSLERSLPGRWWMVCRTKSPDQDSCPGRSTTSETLEIRADGSVTRVSSINPDPMEGTWTLEGSTLDFTYDVAYFGEVTDRTEARIAGTYLVVWYPGSEFGRLYLREGVAFEPPKGQRTGSGTQAGSVGEVDYSLTFPAPHRLTFDDVDRDRWDPLSGTGLTFEVSLRERARSESTDGTQTSGCTLSEGELSTGSSSSQRSGEPERLKTVSASLCLEDMPYSLVCRAKHTRGHIEPHERAGAESICGTLKRGR